jgi:TRAP-type uncharacterized transport system substrate-binding protein
MSKKKLLPQSQRIPEMGTRRVSGDSGRSNSIRRKIVKLVIVRKLARFWNPKTPEGQRRIKRYLIIIALAAYLLFVVGNLLYNFLLVERHVNIAVGPPTSYSYAVGQKLETWLTENGVSTSLTVVEDTLSAIEEVNDNEDAIRDPNMLNVALVAQNLNSYQYPNIDSLGSIASQPLLIFARAELGQNLVLADLEGKTVSIGVPGSDVNQLMTDILKTYGFSSNLDVRSDPTNVGVEQLLAGKVDALALLYSLRTPIVEELALNPELTIVNLDRASALAFELGYTRPATIPPSYISLARRIPAQPISTVSVELTVVANNFLDEPNVLLIAQQLSVLDPRMRLPSDNQEYPNFVGTEIPASAVALDYYKSGAPFQYSIVPDWVISWVWIPLARVFAITLAIWFAISIVVPLIGKISSTLRSLREN